MLDLILLGMLNGVSWSQFLIAICILLVVYYSVVYLKYFRKPRELNVGLDEPAYDEETRNTLAENSDELFNQAEELTDRIAECISTAGVEGATKDEILENLRAHVAQYPLLNTPAFREGIKNVIITETDRNGVVTLGESEVYGIWG